MSEEVAAAAADLETVRQLRAALDVAMEENDQHHAYEKTLEAKFGRLSRQIGELNTTICYQDAMLTELRRALECLLAKPTNAAQTRARAALAIGKETT